MELKQILLLKRARRIVYKDCVQGFPSFEQLNGHERKSLEVAENASILKGEGGKAA